MILDISFEQETLRIVNIYHRIPIDRDGHKLLHLLSSSLDPFIPTLLLGDFNTHSHIWSLPTATISPWAAELMDWFDNQGLELLNPPRTAMWRSHQDRVHPSVLDLALINEAAVISGQISPLSISFEDSVSSDHAALSLFWYPAEAIAIAPPPELTGYQSTTTSSRSGPHSSLPYYQTPHPFSPLTTFARRPFPSTKISTPLVPWSSNVANSPTPIGSVGGTKTARSPSQPSTWLLSMVKPIRQPSALSETSLPNRRDNGHMTSYITQPPRISGKLLLGVKGGQSNAFPLSSHHTPPSHTTPFR